MVIPMRGVVASTCLVLMVVFLASGQSQKGANTAGARTETAQLLPDVRPLPSEMTQRFQQLGSLLQPSAKAWVDQQAQVLGRQRAPEMSTLEAAIRNRFSGAGAAAGASPNAARGNAATSAQLQGGDVEAVVFIVMMQVAQNADNDLKSTMQAMKTLTQRKQELRQALDAVNQALAPAAKGNPNAVCTTPACQSLPGELRQFSMTAGQLPHPVRLPTTDRLTNGQIAELQQQMQQNLNALNEISETQSLELQMTMDRRSKLIDTLSNVLKKISDTGDSVVQNLK